MREIKFRYIYKFENEFEIEYFTLEDIENIENVNNYFTKNLIARNQYIGLHDKNGKEIYEGDKIKFRYYINLFTHEKIEQQAVIEYNNNDGCFYAKDIENKQLYFINQVKGDLEVIGNIYENPELIEVK